VRMIAAKGAIPHETGPLNDMPSKGGLWTIGRTSQSPTHIEGQKASSSKGFYLLSLSEFMGRTSCAAFFASLPSHPPKGPFLDFCPQAVLPMIWSTFPPRSLAPQAVHIQPIGRTRWSTSPTFKP
jgi:hypothetical protein